MRVPALCTLFAAVLLAGCGVTSPVNNPVAAAPNVSGNWELAGTPVGGSTTLPGPVSAFMGSLQNSGGNVTGILRALPTSVTPCVSIFQDLAVTGTVSPANLLTLNIPIAGGTATVTALLGSNLQSFGPVTYTITGGTCAMPATVGIISQFAPLTGTYTGTLSESLPASGPTATATAVLNQSTTPNADGMFPLTGTVTLTGACATTFSFPGGLVSGNSVNSFLLPTYPPPPGVLRGAFPATAATLLADVELDTQACPGTFFQGTLTRQ